MAGCEPRQYHGDKGQAFSGLPEEGLLPGELGKRLCRADYRLDISKNMNGIVMAKPPAK